MTQAEVNKPAFAELASGAKAVHSPIAAADKRMADVRVRRWYVSVWASGWLIHSVRTAVATTASLLFARLFKMPEPYWAAVTTVIVMQSTLGGSWGVSKRRIIGTALGAGTGGLMATYFGANIFLFAAALFLLGILCWALRLDPAAYRFSGVALSIVALVHHADISPFTVAFQRFAEVFIGIVVALVISAVWPAREVMVEKG